MICSKTADRPFATGFRLKADPHSAQYIPNFEHPSKIKPPRGGRATKANLKKAGFCCAGASAVTMQPRSAFPLGTSLARRPCKRLHFLLKLRIYIVTWRARKLAAVWLSLDSTSVGRASSLSDKNVTHPVTSPSDMIGAATST